MDATTAGTTVPLPASANYSIQDVVRAFPVSTRLYNCLHRATNLPFSTVGAYIAAGEEAMPKTMVAIKNFGRRSAEELDSLVRQVASGALQMPASAFANSAVDIGDDGVADDQVAALLSLTIEEAAAVLGASPATADGLAGLRTSGGFVPYFSLLDFYADEDNALRKLSMLGGGMARELYELFIKVRPNTPFFGALMDEIRSEGSVYHRALRAMPKPIDLINQLVATIEPNLQAILRFRYGYGGEVDHTLHEIGDKLGVTRERVRQLEVKALGRLWPYSDFIHESLAANRDHIWSYTKAPFGVLNKRTFDLKYFLEYVIPGEIELGLDIIFQCEISKFFEFMSCRETDTAWFRSEYSDSEISNASKRINDFLQSRPLPVSLHSVAAHLGLALDLVGLAASISNVTTTCEGYVIEGRATRRTQRALRLHKLLGELCSSCAVPLADLVNAFNTRYPSAACSERDALIVMGNLPHLFLSLADYGWKSIGDVVPLGEDEVARINIASSGPQDIVSNTDDVSDEISLDVSSSTATELLRDLLRNGPCSLGDITAAFVERADGRFSRSSVGPLLAMMADVRRAAPGVYALNEHVRAVDLARGEVPMLLEPGSCRLYVMARHAGEPRGSFPFWTIGMERAWCRWAEARERADSTLESRLLYESLLSIAAPEDWSSSDQDYWIKQKELRGRYALESDAPPLYESVPEPIDILRTLEYLADQGEVNWISVNRLSQKVVNSYAAATLLAFLIGLGAVIPARHWQVVHECGDTAHHWRDRLRQHQSTFRGSPTWQDDVPQEMLAAVNDRLYSAHLGWVDISQLREVINRYLVNETITDEVEEAATDDTDALLAAFREEKRIERMNRLLAEVELDSDTGIA